jgi:hypothetical protein
VVIDPEVNAAAWGVVGRRDILGNLVFARVEAPGRSWSIGRLDPNGRLLDPQPLDTDTLLALAAEAQLAGREWGGAPVVPFILSKLAAHVVRLAMSAPSNRYGRSQRSALRRRSGALSFHR